MIMFSLRCISIAWCFSGCGHQSSIHTTGLVPGWRIGEGWRIGKSQETRLSPSLAAEWEVNINMVLGKTRVDEFKYMSL